MNPIETTYSSGATLYAVVHHTDGRIWNNDGSAWEAFNDARWAQYAIPMTEQGSSGYYRAEYPEDAGGVLTTEVVYNQADVAPALGDAPATGIGQSQGVDVAAIKANVTAASNLEKSAGSMIQGAVTSAGASTVSVIYTDLDDTITNAYQGRLLVFVTGNLIHQVANISAYNAVTHTITVAGPFTEAPAVADAFIIV